MNYREDRNSWQAETTDQRRASKRAQSRLIARRKIEARKDGVRTLVDVASLKSYYASLPKKTDHAPLVFVRRAHLLPRSRNGRRRS